MLRRVFAARVYVGAASDVDLSYRPDPKGQSASHPRQRRVRDLGVRMRGSFLLKTAISNNLSKSVVRWPFLP